MPHSMHVPVIHADNFRRLRENQGYYVDKTAFLESFLQAPAAATLFTRPGRFGKTLMLSMLAEFFDSTKDSRALFQGLAITANRQLCDTWMNSHPVLALNLKDTGGSQPEESRAALTQVLADAAALHGALLESTAVDAADRELLQTLLASRDSVPDEILFRALPALARALSAHHGQAAIVLIDEYDAPVTRARGTEHADAMLQCLHNLLAPLLRPQPWLAFCVLTGCLPDTMVSLVENLEDSPGQEMVAEQGERQCCSLACFGIRDAAFADVFGFTQAEVDRLLQDTGLLHCRDEVGAWCGGYRFGTPDGKAGNSLVELHCPWSVLHFVQSLRLHGNTRLNREDGTFAELVRGLGTSLSPVVQDKLACLFALDAIAATLAPAPGLVGTCVGEEAFWARLYGHGYLTLARQQNPAHPGASGSPAPGQVSLVLPNREIREVFAKKIWSLFQNLIEGDEREAFMKAFWQGQAESFGGHVDSMLLKHPRLRPEEARDHHELFMLCMLREVFNERDGEAVTAPGTAAESVDSIVLIRAWSRAAVLVVRHAARAEELEACAEEGLHFLADNHCDAPLQEDGYVRILHWSIAYCGESCIARVQSFGL